jgi:hypothetical protein
VLSVLSPTKSLLATIVACISPIPLLTPDVQYSGYSIASDRVTPLKTPFGLVIPFITIAITRHYNHSQLSITLLHVYTIIILIRSRLQSLIPLSHVYTAYVHYTLIFTAL